MVFNARFSSAIVIVSMMMVMFHGTGRAFGQGRGVEGQTAEPLELEKFSFRQPAMGTLFVLTLYAKDQITANRAAKSAFDRIKELDAALSDYKPDSELNKLSRSSGSGQAVPVGSDLWKMLEFSKSLNGETEGGFDVTIGPLVRLWRSARKKKILPDRSTLSECKKSVGSELILLDEVNRRVTLEQPDMQLDLGGVAKGYALDEALTVVRKKFDITRALIDGGGDVLAGDPPPGRSAWNVAVRDPRGDGNRWIVPLANASIATSGDVHQFIEIGGERYSHIVDPRTGMGLTHRIQVSILAPTGTEADALASAVSVLGAKKGIQFIRTRAGCEAMVASAQKGAETQAIFTDGFPRQQK